MSTRRTASVGRTSGAPARTASVGRAASSKPTSSLTPLDSKPAKGPMRALGATPASRFGGTAGSGKPAGGVKLTASSSASVRPAVKQPGARVDSAPHVARGATKTSTSLPTNNSMTAAPRRGFEESAAPAPQRSGGQPAPRDAFETPPRSGDRARPSAVENSDPPAAVDTSAVPMAVCPSPPRAEPSPQSRHRPEPASASPASPASPASHATRETSASVPTPVNLAPPVPAAAQAVQSKEAPKPADRRPAVSAFRVSATAAASWPELSADENALLDGKDMEERGGEYFYHFEKNGAYACRRCRSMIARADSKVRKEGGYAAFASYTSENLKCLMHVGKWSTQFHVRCAKCDAFVGPLTKEATATGDCLRANSKALWYVQVMPTTVLPADSTFEHTGSQESNEGDDDEECSDDSDGFDDELDRAFR